MHEIRGTNFWNTLYFLRLCCQDETKIGNSAYRRTSYFIFSLKLFMTAKNGVIVSSYKENTIFLPIKQIDMTKLFVSSDTGHTCNSQGITDFFSLIYLLCIYDFCPDSFFFQFFYLLFHSFQLCYVFVLFL